MFQGVTIIKHIKRIFSRDKVMVSHQPFTALTSTLHTSPTDNNEVQVNVVEHGENGALLSVLSTEGEIIHSQNAPSNRTSTIGLANLSPGIYFIRLESDRSLENLRLIKK